MADDTVWGDEIMSPFLFRTIILSYNGRNLYKGGYDYERKRI